MEHSNIVVDMEHSNIVVDMEHSNIVVDMEHERFIQYILVFLENTVDNCFLIDTIDDHVLRAIAARKIRALDLKKNF